MIIIQNDDTKAISTAIEDIGLRIIETFCKDNNYELKKAKSQNCYPDATLINKSNKNEIYALDIKSSFYTGLKINGFTLGTYQGYFRNRESIKNITLPYNVYKEHFVLALIYKTASNATIRVKSAEEMENVPSLLSDVDCMFGEKWKFASKYPGSGNTTNIGSHKYIEDLKSGSSNFLNKQEFDNY